MTERLARRASGARHLRWGREVRATVDAHITQNDRLTDAQRSALTAERDTLDPLIASCATSVGDYRGWLDTSHIGIRASLRVANYLADETQTVVDGTLRPVRDALAAVLPGGMRTVFSNLPLSRVLRAGHVRTAQLARKGASAVATVSGTGGLPDLTGLAGQLDSVAKRIEDLIEHQDEVIEPQRRPLKLAVERAILELRHGLELMDARLRPHFTPAFIESLYPELGQSGTAVADTGDEETDDTEEPPTAVS